METGGGKGHIYILIDTHIYSLFLAVLSFRISVGCPGALVSPLWTNWSLRTGGGGGGGGGIGMKISGRRGGGRREDGIEEECIVEGGNEGEIEGEG